MLEELIAYHCAPALAGIKPANIFSFLRSEYPCAERGLEAINGQLNCVGIYCTVLCSCEKRVMVMVYRKNKLEEYLALNGIKKLLNGCGYHVEAGCEECIDTLSKRIGSCMEFPHEIGAFLGYPEKDIYGFIHRRSECLYTGYWKVYDDVENSKRRFKRYDRCRKAVMQKIKEGRTIADIFCGGKKDCA